MAEAAAKTVLDKISQGHLECPICCCRFKDPKMLDCLHSFCLNCLEEMMNKKKSETEKITCPVCRSETQVPDKGLLNLSSSFVLSSLVDEVKQQETLLGKVSRPTATCDCGDDRKATWRCLDCSDNLCQKCREAHVRVKYTKNHQIISFEDWHKSVIPGPKADHVKPITRMCTNHTDQALCFYCDTCDTFICIVCVAIDHRSAEHSYKKIDDSVRSFRRHVDDALLQFEKCKLRVKSTINSIKHARNRLQNKLAQARSDISAKAEAEIAKIRNKAKLLTEKVDQIGQERDSEYKKALMHNCDQVKRADQIVTAVNDLMKQADDFELLELKAKVANNLEFQKELNLCEPAKLDMAFIGVKCQDVVGNKDLGEVRISEKWQLKEEFGEEGTDDEEFQFARGVTCFSNGDIVVCDFNLERVSLFSANGRYKLSIAQGSDSNQLESPAAVAVNCDDMLFVADQSKVKVFDTELQFVREFTPSVDDAEGPFEIDIDCIAVDKQRVAVADFDRNVISVHNLDGSLIASTSNIMVRFFIAMSNKEQLIFTNYVEKRLLCVDLRGNEVFNVMPLLKGKPAKPTGVLCDDDGSIYVAVHAESGEFGDGEVQHYDSNGAFIKTVRQGLDFPLGMAFTPVGDIVVAEKHSVKIFERM
ncbi:tripartite motif-containing protein 2-like [Patiria miniata]|uniref:Uncharacterized protein n=1 Tax=Patiria miniata TaxID=46514 RepID=A0A913ZKQ5_PATMI|nr:tripartite motif-containing protein 2-like [Patiria miniata]